MKLASRVIVIGPMNPQTVAGIVTLVHQDGVSIDAVCFPPGSPTGLCVHLIEPMPSTQAEVQPGRFYYRPADPEPLALTVGAAEFAQALTPLIAAAVENYASQQEDPDDGA